jgi:hypothetical protein
MMNESKHDILWISIVSILILFLGSIPTWSGYKAETPDLRFRGIYFDSQDYAVHIATMEAGRHGEWGYQFRFTTEPHSPAYIRLFYIALGHVSHWLGLTSPFTFQAARWVFSLLALFTLYGLMRQVFSDRFWARVAFLLATLGSGLGWLQLILNWMPGAFTPIDFWLIDSYVFFSLSIFPHFAFVTAAMCVAMQLWLQFLEKQEWKKIVVISFTAVLVQFVNPIAFATVDAGLVGAAMFVWWRDRKIRRQDVLALVTLATVQIPLLAYNLIVLSSDPLWSQFTAQNQTLSPPLEYYLCGFALLWLPAIVGLVLAFRVTPNAALGAALFWVTCGFILAYAPFYIQRRFLQNITIPLAILATTGCIKLFEIAATRSLAISHRRTLLVMLFVFLTSISSLQIGLSQAAYLQTHPNDLFYPASLDRAIDWFQNNAHYNDFVLASEHTSQVLAQKAGLRAYMGHEMETLRYKDKMSEVEAFYQGKLPELANKPIKWVVYGPFERQLGPEFDAPVKLEIVYDSYDLQIYQVR